jgi:hypothetical protein
VTTKQATRGGAPPGGAPGRPPCLCDPLGPFIVATFALTGAIVVTLEHFTYCPVPNAVLDGEIYRDTGEWVIIEQRWDTLRQ